MLWNLKQTQYLVVRHQQVEAFTSLWKISYGTNLAVVAMLLLSSSGSIGQPYRCHWLLVFMVSYANWKTGCSYIFNAVVLILSPKSWTQGKMSKCKIFFLYDFVINSFLARHTGIIHWFSHIINSDSSVLWWWSSCIFIVSMICPLQQIKVVTAPSAGVFHIARPSVVLWSDVTGTVSEHLQWFQTQFFFLKSNCWSTEWECAVRCKAVKVEQTAAGH